VSRIRAYSYLRLDKAHPEGLPQSILSRLFGPWEPHMTRRRSDVLGLLVFASLAAPVFAVQTAVNHLGGTTATENAIQSVYDVVPGRRSDIVEQRGMRSSVPASIGLNIPGGLWSYPDNGEGWVGRAVALGASGTQVFTEFDVAADRAALLSGFDTVPVVPVWANPVTTASTNVRVHAADASGSYVSCRQIPVSINGPRNIVVSAYESSSPTPRFTWTFPTTTYGASRAMISSDGTRIVAVMLAPTTALVHIAIFDNGSPVPTAYFTHFVGIQLQAVTMSEDGRVLYVATTNGGYMFDMDTRTLIQQFPLLQSFAAQDISGDGSILAIGYFNGVDIWERQVAGNYLRTWQGSWPGSIVCQQLDVSEDGSTLALGFGYFDQNLRVRVEAIDVRTKQRTMSEEVQGSGTLQNIVARVSCSADGKRFAVGLWGDQGNLVPELRIYRRNSDTPIATYNYGGSVYDVAMSPDGDRVVVGTKAVHANLLSGGGTIDLYSSQDEDFTAVGTPSIGRKVDFALWGAPNSPARLLVAPSPAQTPNSFGQMGVLYLNRTQLSILPMSATGSSGQARGEYQLPPDPALIGRTLWFQGFTTSPRRFTLDYVQLTILP